MKVAVISLSAFVVGVVIALVCVFFKIDSYERSTNKLRLSYAACLEDVGACNETSKVEKEWIWVWSEAYLDLTNSCQSEYLELIQQHYKEYRLNKDK